MILLIKKKFHVWYIIEMFIRYTFKCLILFLMKYITCLKNSNIYYYINAILN